MRFLKILIFLILISCNNDKEIAKNKSQIINLLYHNYSKETLEFFVFPVKNPHSSNDTIYKNNIDYKIALSNQFYADSIRNLLYEKMNSEDSLKKINYYLSQKENRQIYAIDLKMEKYHNLENKKIKLEGFELLFLDFIKRNEKDFIDISNILPKYNDSIIKFEKSSPYNILNSDFENFDVLISFSNVHFNKKFSKAIIIGTIGFSNTDFNSKIYFFEKNGKNWTIKHEIPI